MKGVVTPCIGSEMASPSPRSTRRKRSESYHILIILRTHDYIKALFTDTRLISLVNVLANNNLIDLWGVLPVSSSLNMLEIKSNTLKHVTGISKKCIGGFSLKGAR